MLDADSEAAFNAALCARVRQVREERAWTQEKMADLLNIPVERYRKYEKRSPIPMYLVPRLSALTDTEVEWLVTGKGRRPLRLIRQAKAY